MLVGVISALPSTGYRAYLLFYPLERQIVARHAYEPTTESIQSSMMDAESSVQTLRSQGFWERYIAVHLPPELLKKVHTTRTMVGFSVATPEINGQRHHGIEVLVMLPHGGEAVFDAISEGLRAFLLERWKKQNADVIKYLQNRLLQLQDELAQHPPKEGNQLAIKRSQIEAIAKRIEAMRELDEIEANEHDLTSILPFDPYKPPQQWCFECR